MSLHLIALAWGFVVVLMSLAEAMSPRGSILGALFTFVLYGVLPLALVLYLVATPQRRRARRAAEAAASAEAPDQRRHPSSDAVAPVREEA